MRSIIQSEGKILEQRDEDIEKMACVKPTCFRENGIVHMFYRAVDLQSISSIGYCQLVDNKVIKRSSSPVLFPESAYEAKGLEDPRIVFLEGTYYLFYTAYDGHEALVAYAT